MPESASRGVGGGGVGWCAWSGRGVSGPGGGVPGLGGVVGLVRGGGWVPGLGGGVPSRGGGGGVPGPGGGSASVPCGIPPPPPVNRMTNRCKNITLATTSLRPVITCKLYCFESVNELLGPGPP